MIGLVLPLLLAIPTIQFSRDRKRQSRKRNQNAVSTRSLSSTLLITTPTLCIASENQPLKESTLLVV